MLLTGATIEGILMFRDTVIVCLFVFSIFGAFENFKKSILNLGQEIEFLGLRLNSLEMTASLT